ncbi:hypothetical protein CJA_0103 [Cellvibrio japonicus Ueda107]|uniref:Uncharacterized protein n=1 Tax=Cellvibrio japonicus (strain Ueda107) TaxID=498211 RepID=B3PFI7_CELJU|nr:hypothetical protein CJA_0103 [Cellvibrio japonicus Ueda107]
MRVFESNNQESPWNSGDVYTYNSRQLTHRQPFLPIACVLKNE